MKKIYITLLILLTILLFGCDTNRNSGKGLEYNLINNNEYSVVGIGTCENNNILIPSEYNGLPVTGIGDTAFAYCENLVKVTIPESIKSIGEGAFYMCTSLKKILFHDGIESIGDNVFTHCASLEEIRIPDSIKNIGISSFSFCNNLKYNEYDNALYLGNSGNEYLVLVKSKTKDITSCVINSSTKFIMNGAFGYCEALKSIVIPKNVISIGKEAFQTCPSLEKIEVEVENQKYDSRNNCNAIIDITTNKLIQGCKNTIIPEGIINIGESAFFGCYSLINIIIPESVTTIEDSAFFLCKELQNVNYTGSEQQWQNIIISKDGNEYFTNANITYNNSLD